MTGERIDNPMARNDGVFGARDPEYECDECGGSWTYDGGCPECDADFDREENQENDRHNGE